MPQDPAGVLFYCVVVSLFCRMWLRDYRDVKKSPELAGKVLPGAAPFTWKAVLVAVAGTLFLLGLETWGEIELGISEEQSDTTAFFLLAYLAGAIAEEFIFRGFLVVESRGNLFKWLSIFVFSALFALIHPYLFEFSWPEDESLSFFQKLGDSISLNLTLKAAFSTSFIFIGSLWFYFVRFFKLNPQASIFVPIAAHLAKNLFVFLIKLAQGHVTAFF